MIQKPTAIPSEQLYTDWCNIFHAIRAPAVDSPYRLLAYVSIQSYTAYKPKYVYVDVLYILKTCLVFHTMRRPVLSDVFSQI